MKDERAIICSLIRKGSMITVLYLLLLRGSLMQVRDKEILRKPQQIKKNSTYIN